MTSSCVRVCGIANHSHASAHFTDQATSLNGCAGGLAGSGATRTLGGAERSGDDRARDLDLDRLPFFGLFFDLLGERLCRRRFAPSFRSFFRCSTRATVRAITALMSDPAEDPPLARWAGVGERDRDGGLGDLGRDLGLPLGAVTAGNLGSAGDGARPTPSAFRRLG